MRLRKVLLILIIFFGCLAALFALLEFIPGYWVFEELAGVALYLALMSAVALACLYSRERGRYPRFMLIGSWTAVMSAALVALAVLAEEILPRLTGFSPPIVEMGEWAMRVGAGLTILSLSAGQWGLLSLLRLDQPRNRRVRAIARWSSIALMFLLWSTLIVRATDEVTMFLTAAVFGHLVLLVVYMRARRHGPTARCRANFFAVIYVLVLAVQFWQAGWITMLVERTYRSALYNPYGRSMINEFIVVGSILSVLILTGMVPILALLEPMTRREEKGSLAPALDLQITCPRCNEAQMARTGGANCHRCGLIIRIEIEEPRCECGYLLYQRHGDTCPECGKPIPWLKPPTAPSN